MENLIFPFTAIIGQDIVKKALILNAINPLIGGVLIKGDRGTGKTTTVRALLIYFLKLSTLKIVLLTVILMIVIIFASFVMVF